MGRIITEPSLTYDDLALHTAHTPGDFDINTVDLKHPLTKFRLGHQEEDCLIWPKTPLAPAAMQAVTGTILCIQSALSGCSTFIYASQPIETQAEMVRDVKNFKAGFVVSRVNASLEMNLENILEMVTPEEDEKEKPIYHTIPVTHNGTAHGKLLGLLTQKRYRRSSLVQSDKVDSFMLKVGEGLITAEEGTSLKDANKIMEENFIDCLPIVDEKGCLKYLVFQKDYKEAKDNRLQLIDEDKSLVVGAAINTSDFETRVPALVDAGVDFLCVDSSDGFDDWQMKAMKWIHEKYDNTVKIGAGNVITREGFLHLAQEADFVKIGMGGGSICITSMVKPTGRGQATAVHEISRAREELFEKTKIYVPICADGAAGNARHFAIALGLGADFVMAGGFFASTTESPGEIKIIDGVSYKEYWGEGSKRAQQIGKTGRYDPNSHKLQFEEGVDGLVPYYGETVRSVILDSRAKLLSTMRNVGAWDLREFSRKCVFQVRSPLSIKESDYRVRLK